MDLVVKWAHEYTHAMQFGLNAQGIDIEQRALELGYIRHAKDFLIDDLRFITAEHFARSMEDRVEEIYVREKLGWTTAQISEFVSRRDNQQLAEAESGYTLLSCLINNGFTPTEIYKLQACIEDNVIEWYGEEHAHWYYVPISFLAAYEAAPYSREQFEQLVKRD